MSADDLHGDEPDVTVLPSFLDPTVWICYGTRNDYAVDMENPGRLRAVQRYAVEEYAAGCRVRWERVYEGRRAGWRMRIAAAR